MENKKVIESKDSWWDVVLLLLILAFIVGLGVILGYSIKSTPRYYLAKDISFTREDCNEDDSYRGSDQIYSNWSILSQDSSILIVSGAHSGIIDCAQFFSMFEESNHISTFSYIPPPDYSNFFACYKNNGSKTICSMRLPDKACKLNNLKSGDNYQFTCDTHALVQAKMPMISPFQSNQNTLSIVNGYIELK